MRIYGVCNYNPETVVLCHTRVANVAGMGQKPPDFPGCFFFGCNDCHDVYDGRRKTDLTRVQLESHALHAVVRSAKIVSEKYKLIPR